ncbi:MAG TPA: hypothetical protein PLU67_00570 [Candidatus Kapabacteria bacterium]|jgi:outer membrane protein assembly factor BamB|nr:hypothetical protein [Candidatus Kapabacteria bacterium]HPP38960.1 hypothetical protein [Candidatus Kapabacteria bacterium]HPU22782.1 hypothetical protein [Candidatus Kapabacteria bacterium]
MKKSLILLFWISVIVSSCGNPFKEGVFNAGGSFTRSNDYSNYKKFSINVLEAKRFDGRSDTSLTAGSQIEPLVVGNNDYYLISADGTISFISKDILKSTFMVPDSTPVSTRPAADHEQNIYFVSLKPILYSFNNHGEKRWEYKFSDEFDPFEMFSDVLATNDGVLIGTTSGKLIKVSFDGKLIFQKQYNTAISRAFAADENGNIYFVLTKNTFGDTDNLVKIDKNGKELYNKPIDFVRIIRNPVVSGDNVYLIGFMQNADKSGSLLICFDKRGFEKWRQELPVFPRYLSANEQNAYVIGYNTGVGETMSGVFSFSRTGKQNWRIFLSISATSPLIVGKAKSAVVGTNPNGAGIFFLDNDNGRLIEDRSLNEIDTFYTVPAVTGDGSIIFAMSARRGIVRLTDTALNKILPW